MKASFLHRFFVPSQHNNYRARSLHISSLTVYLLGAIILSFSFGSKSILPAGTVLGIAQNMSVDKLLELTNQQRVNSGLAALSLNSQLSQAAAGKCNKMLADNFWAHYAPDGTSPWFFISQSGYKYETAGENLAKDFNDSDSVVNAWMASSTHAANILNGRYQDIGFATCNGTLTGSETTLVVQMFGRPTGAAAIATNFTTAANASEIKPTSAPTAPTRSPTLLPSVAPTTEPTVILSGAKDPNSTLVSSIQASTNKPALIESLIKSMPKTASFAFFGMLMFILFLDFIYAYKLKTLRMVGKHMAHFIFVAFVLISLLIAANGAIL